MSCVSVNYQRNEETARGRGGIKVRVFKARYTQHIWRLVWRARAATASWEAYTKAHYCLPGLEASSLNQCRAGPFPGMSGKGLSWGYFLSSWMVAFSFTRHSPCGCLSPISPCYKATCLIGLGPVLITL